VNVICCPVDRKRFHLISFCDAAKIWPEAFAKIRSEARFAIFCAPDAMNKAAGERMHDRLFLSSLPALKTVCIIENPALKTLSYDRNNP
jgi:hypothetical protein